MKARLPLGDRRITVAQLLGGAKVVRIESFVLDESGALIATLELERGRLACLEFRPGQPIVVRVVA